MIAKKPAKIFWTVLIVAVLAVSLFLITGLVEKIVNRLHEEPQSPGYSSSGDLSVFFDGKQYKRNDTLETILVMGIDSLETPDGSREDSAQADFVALIILDKLNKSFRILHINRDTMTEIQRSDALGTASNTFTGQLALAHTFGKTDELRCRNMVAAVENLLYFPKNTSIDHYFSLTMDAIPMIADGVGGVTVTLENDFPLLGEEYVKGATVTLTGEDALTFVRYRNNDATGSNMERMERQRLFIAGLFAKYTQHSFDDTLDMVEEVTDYFVSDCTVSQISNLVDRLQTYTDNGVQALPGEAKLGREYVEFYVDEEALQRLIVDCFYIPVPTAQ